MPQVNPSALQAVRADGKPALSWDSAPTHRELPRFSAAADVLVPLGSMHRRIAITGLGVVAPNGVGVASYRDALFAGRSGIDRIRLFNPEQLPSQMAGEVHDPLPLVLPKEISGMPVDVRPLRFGLHAALEALEQSGLPSESTLAPDRRVVVVGGSSADRVTEILGTALMQISPEAAGDLKALNDQKIAEHLAQVNEVDSFSAYAMARLGPMLATLCNARQLWTLSTACAGGGQAIRDAARMVARGQADWALAIGVDSLISRQMMAGFCQLSAMSVRNDNPQAASRPFDLERDGFVMGEGGGALIMEPLDQAQKRGAVILAELVGTGISSDAYRLTDPRPDGVGMVLAMKRALQDARCNPADVQYINAHGTSTQANDAAESLAIKQVFGPRAQAPAISSTKGMTGHLIHGAGAIEAVACILSLQHQVLAPTINYETPDPDCDLDVVPNEARETTVDTVLSNSFGFGGQNTTLAFRRWAGA